MASESCTISIKLLIDQETNKVILAEAGNDFVDTLRTLLTFPLGNIARLVGKYPISQPGCLNNLYNSVENLGLNSFRSHACKSMLLYPRSIHEDKSKNLKLLIDFTEPTKCSCGELMSREIKLWERDAATDETEGVLCKVESMFFITDDLRVMQGFPGHLINFLSDLGVENVNHIAVKVLEIGPEEISHLLSHSLLSKTTFTDVFLRKQENLSSRPMVDEQFMLGAVNMKEETTKNDGKISVNVMLRKSDRKIVCAKASGNFVDLLFSFLTIPLESVLELLRGKGSLAVGSISNLFTDLDSIFSITKQKAPKGVILPPFYSCSNEFPDIKSLQPPEYFCHSDWETKRICLSRTHCRFSYTEVVKLLKLLDPKSTKVNTTNSRGYVHSGSLFVVTDDLVVKSLSSVSSIALLQEIGIRPADVEQQVINIGEAEARALLRACLCSSSPLSVLLDVKQPKEEPF
ncbi:hypothetical protein like AT5G01120 [Hibiscus trionum]|uniref:DUF674 family protein n=1 Tax=Hibiscus trionum TaxID=183268 RepID=A0A9W7IUC5_HIBTR|nr:hypothetical protein like AT5G01120 [Hibiscus trionum]